MTEQEQAKQILLYQEKMDISEQTLSMLREAGYVPLPVGDPSDVRVLDAMPLGVSQSVLTRVALGVLKEGNDMDSRDQRDKFAKRLITAIEQESEATHD